jgi:hypothetical protein
LPSLTRVMWGFISSSPELINSDDNMYNSRTFSNDDYQCPSQLDITLLHVKILGASKLSIAFKIVSPYISIVLNLHIKIFKLIE